MNSRLLYELNALGQETFLSLIETAKDYALYKGIAKRDLKLTKDTRIHLPFCLLPCEFPKDCFDYVYSLQKSLNLVLYKVSHSREFLRECLSSTIETDEFTRNLFIIFEAVYDRQFEQTSLGLIRSDYLLSRDPRGFTNGIKQVENNTIASGLGGISPLVKDLYQFISERLYWRDFCEHLPENKSCSEMASAMVSAWHLYGQNRAVFLFVVEESTFNIFDQRILEYKILEFNRRLEVVRYTFKDLRNNLQLRGKELFVYGKEVAVVYFRYGYAPEHYQVVEDWNTRMLIEKSRAIKCPSVGLHLAGTKKVQEYLTKDGVLERFIEPEIAEKLRKVFANQYSLDMENAKEIILKAIKNPEMFVLKAEREGGGNNLYGLDISRFLESGDNNDKKSYILMERIDSPEVQNIIIRSDAAPEFCAVNSELGIFGVILGNNDNIFLNAAVGHLLRSKPSNVTEGGIASNKGALSYPFLV